MKHPLPAAGPDHGSLVAKPVTGPFLYTFTCRLPFVLGVADGFNHEIELSVDYVNEQDAEVFHRRPFVRLRILSALIPDRKFWPTNMPVAVEYFYRGDIGPPDEQGAQLYEQWVSLETPAAFFAGERQTDPAYAFHRSLSVLNLFLQAFALARGDDRVRPISARELRPIVVLGSLALNDQWQHLGPMLMHPDAKSRPVGSRPVTVHLQGLNRAMAAILVGEPFVRAWQWRARAERRKYEGDAADSVVSFQIAAESLAYELWGLLLVDEGMTSGEIQKLRGGDLPYKSLLTRELANRLGGSWNLEMDSTPIGRYWKGLYGLRNRVIHAGYLPHDGDAEQAESAFVDFDRFLEGRLKVKAKNYPRALLAKVGQEELEKRGWVSTAMRQFIATAVAEPHPFYLPRDLAGG